MKISATAAVLALAAASAQRVSATDFDFRDFEGLWESNHATFTGTRAMGTTITRKMGTLATVQCEATGDFRKAMCEMTAVANEFGKCVSTNATYPNLVIEGKWILDQFDADTGETKVLMLNTKCCSVDGCQVGDDGPDLGTGSGMVNAQFTMLAGKNNNYVRAIDAKIGGGTDEPFDINEIDLQLRRTAGGFKSYD